MRRVTLAAVGVQGDGHLADARACEARLDDHLGGELHSGAPLVELLVQRLREAAKAAVDVVDGRAEPAPRDPREHRVAEPAMQARHRAGQHASAARLEAATLHEVVPLAEAFDERRRLAEIVAVVRIPHDDEAPARGFDPAHQRGAVPPAGDLHEPRAFGSRDCGGAVGAAVVSDHDLAGDSRVLDGGQRLPDARRERVRLVEAGHHDRHFKRCQLVERHAVGKKILEYVSARAPGFGRLLNRFRACPRFALLPLVARARASPFPRSSVEVQLRWIRYISEQIASARCLVVAWPPRSGVRFLPDATTRSIAPMTRS